MSLVATINRKKEERAKLVKDARDAHEAAEKAGKALQGEERTQWETMISDADALGQEIEKLEALDRQERALLADPAKTEPVEKKADDKPDAEKVKEARNKAWRSYLSHGVREMPSQELRDLSAGTDTAGGYLMPPEDFRATLIKAMDNVVFMRRLSTVYPIAQGDTLGAPTLDTDPSAASWTAEAGTISADSTMAMGKRSLTPNQLTKLLKISMKLLRVSAIPADTLVSDRIAYLLGQALENGYLTGSGSSQPLGVFTASANGINTDRDVSTGNTTTSIEPDNLLENKYNLKAQYWANASWIFSRAAVKQIAKAKDGEGQYMWQPGLQAGQPDRLLGFPVYASELAPSTFTTGLYVGILGDFRAGYWIADLTTMEFQRLNELYAGNSQVGIIGRIWSDGMPVLSEAFSRVKLA